MIGIYYIKNELNGKMYIGQSKKIEIRLSQHKSDLRNKRHPNEVLQRAWNKYGEGNFSTGILSRCEESNLNESEIYWIKELNSDRHKNGYNIEKGGNCSPLSDETKKKISKANRGKKMSKEFCENQSKRMIGKFIGNLNPMYGKRISPEHREKLNAGIKNRIVSQEERERRKYLSTNISDETRKKRSVSLSGERNPMFGKKGILSPFFGKKHTEETKKKMSEFHKGKTTPPERVEKMRLIRQGKPKRGGTSQYAGVSLNSKGRWSAYISYLGKTKNLGSFELEIDAAKAYNCGALEIYGDNANLNKV